MVISTPKWLPAIDQTPELIGILLLFVPYIIILLPLFHNKIIKTLRSLYLHHTPRDDWNPSVDQHPPRRLLAYIFCIIFTFFAISLLLLNNFHTNYWIDFAQYFLYISIPLIISILRPPSHHPCDIFDLLIILLVIIPLEISQINDIFLPDIRFSLYSSWGSSPNISVLQLSAFNLFLFIFFIFRPLDFIGLGFSLKYCKLTRCKWLFLRFIAIMCIFLLLAVPFCLIPAINYLHAPQSLEHILRDGILRFVCLFFLEILTSEFLYRGIIQNLLHAALDFRHEAASYLRGKSGGISAESMMRNKDDEQYDHKDIELLTSSKKREREQNEKREPLISMDISSRYSTLDAGSMTESDVYSMAIERDTISCEEGICYFLRFEHVRDWFVLILASVIYATTVMDYKHYEDTKDLIYGIMLMFWFGFCCGWLFRLTHSCFISALFHALVLFNFKYIFNSNARFCNGAC